MSKHNQLYDLIQSMSKSEKGYFKKYSTRHVIRGKNDYIKLFDAIEKLEVYDEVKLLKKLKTEKFISHFAVLKNYLYKLLLQSLRSYHEKSSLDCQIKSQIAEVRILFERRLAKQASKILQKAKETALRKENLIMLQEINEWERKIIRANFYNAYTVDQLHILEKEQELLLMKLWCLNKYTGINERTFFADYQCSLDQKKTELEKLSLELDRLQKELNPAYATFQSRMVYYRTRSKHASVLSPNQNLIYTEELLRLLEHNPQGILNDPDNYITTVFNLVAGNELLVSTKEQMNVLNKISNFENANQKFLSPNNRLKIFSYLTILKTHLFIVEASFTEGEHYVDNELKKQLIIHEEKINVYDKTVLQFNVLVIYFAVQNFKSALRWSNKIINDENAAIVAKELYLTTKLINLLLHYELKNETTLLSLIKSTERNFKFSNQNTGITQILSEGLKEIVTLSQYGSKIEKEVFQKLKIKMEEQIKLNPNDKLIHNFDFIAWTESKINDSSFADALKSKRQQINN